MSEISYLNFGFQTVTTYMCITHQLTLFHRACPSKISSLAEIDPC